MDNANVVEPEGGRYAADLLLLHGLWSPPEIWGRIAIGLAQRGWRSWLLDLRAASRGRDGSGSARPGDIDRWCAAAGEAARSLDAPPIALGHDAGGLVALALAARGEVRAAIAIAPLLAGTSGLLSRPQAAVARWLERCVPAPAPSHPLFAGVPEEQRARLAATLVPESGRLLGSLRGAAVTPLAPRCAALIVSQGSDPIVSTPLLAITAGGIEADHLVLPGGHWPMLENRVDAWTSHLHRWLIRRAGEGLLILRGDEDLREE
jgi:pimeloyl-ACP methyl ester carboxylesterase